MDKKILDTIRAMHRSELETYLEQVWPSFLVFCRVMDRKKRPGQDVHAPWKPPLPHPFPGKLDLLLEPMLEEKMRTTGFVRASVLGSGFLSVFWEAGSVPAK